MANKWQEKPNSCQIIKQQLQTRKSEKPEVSPSGDRAKSTALLRWLHTEEQIEEIPLSQ
jgi:hypothetical protein